MSLLFLWSLGGATTALAAQPEDTTWRPEFTVSPVAREPAERARMSDYDLAKLGAAVSASPRLRQPRFDLLRALVERGDLVRAEAEAESWRQHDAYNLVAVRMLGDVQHARGEKAKARRTYSAIVELLPREVEARPALATVLKQVGDLDSARQQLSTALELGSSDPRTAFELGDVEQRLGSSEAAQGRFEAIAQAKDADESLRYPARQRLAQIYAAQRRKAIGRRDDVRASKLAEPIRALDLAGGIENDIEVFLSWDTDRTDVDLWVTTPAGERVSYDHPRGRGGEAARRRGALPRCDDGLRTRELHGSPSEPRRVHDSGQLLRSAGSVQESGDAGYLSLRAVTVSARQRGDMAEVSVEHVFHNDSDATIEGAFRFPMQDGAVLTGLAMEIGGKLMEGELVERDKARKIYEAIVDAMQDPALLEWEQGSTFKLRVFPIEPNADKRVVLRYLAPLRAGKEGLVFVQGTRGSPGDQPVPRVTVRFDDRVVFDEADVRPGRIVEVPAKAVAPILREERPDGAYVAVRLSPNWSKVPKTACAVPQHLLVVADTSRSTLEKRKLMLEALRTVLACVPKESKFRVYASDLETRAQPEGFAAPASATIERAMAFVAPRRRTPARGRAPRLLGSSRDPRGHFCRA